MRVTLTFCLFCSSETENIQSVDDKQAMSTDVAAVVEDAWNETAIYQYREPFSAKLQPPISRLFCRDARFAIWIWDLCEQIWLFDMKIGVNRFASC